MLNVSSTVLQKTRRRKPKHNSQYHMKKNQRNELLSVSIFATWKAHSNGRMGKSGLKLEVHQG